MSTRCMIPTLSIAVVLVALALPLPDALAPGRARSALALEPAQAREDRLRVCVTTPDLGSLATSVGGDEVDVTVFVRGPEDPHFLDAKPSFVKHLSTATLFVYVGLDLEQGWAPVLWQQSRNARVLPGAAGNVDASRVVAVREAATGIVDRSMGDVHPFGNPHYLVDPVNGLHVAALIRDRLIEARPAKRSHFEARFAELERRLGTALFGESLASGYDPEKLALLLERGGLDAFLRDQKQEALLGGWLERVRRFRGTKIVTDHNLWPYFAARFGLEVVEFLEPKPGIAPTTSHMQSVIERMKAESVRFIITVPYFNPRYARFVAENAAAHVVELAHQCGAVPGTDDYIAMVDHNVKTLVDALARGTAPP